MPAKLVFTIALILTCGVCGAQETGDIQEFNEAWRDFHAAIEASQLDQQIEASTRAVTAARRVFPETDERLPMVLSQHGAVLIENNEYEEAQAVLMNALHLAEGIHGEESVELVPILTKLARAYANAVDSKAISYYKRALRLTRKTFGRRSDEYAALSLATGLTLYSNGDLSASKRYLKDAYDYYQETKGEAAFETGLASFSMAKLEFGKRRYEATTKHLSSAIIAFQGDDEMKVQYQLHARALMVQAYESWGKPELATEHCVAIGKVSKLRVDQDYQPLFRMAPIYPQSMLVQGQQGFVDISFSVDEWGFVRNPEVVDKGKGDGGFVNAALDAVERFRYAPRFVDGNAVTVDDVKTRITFRIE